MYTSDHSLVIHFLPLFRRFDYLTFYTRPCACVRMCARTRMCVCAGMRVCACVRAFACACVRVCECLRGYVRARVVGVHACA